ncbi:MAG: hypothetical protein J5903_00735 [Clostridia bacterium]|nr:hypothetical protein [Clostridia bacterium]
MSEMMVLTTEFIKRAINAGGVWFFAIPVFPCCACLILFAAGIFSKKARYADKSSLTALTCAFGSLWYALYLLAYGNGEAHKLLPAAISALSLNFFISFFLVIQSRMKVSLTRREKRLIGLLSAKTANKNNGDTGGRIRRVEYVGATEHGGVPEPNLNEIKAYIERLRKYDLSTEEEDELDKAEIDVEKLSGRVPTPFERQNLSDRLMRVVKISALYGADVKNNKTRL